MKLNLIYYKNVLDLAMKHFFDEYNDSFTKQNDIYIFSLNASKSQLKSIFEKMIGLELQSICQNDTVTNDKYVLIGSCYPKDSILLDFKEDSYIPKKIELSIKDKPQLKWLLKEKGISIDIDSINETLISIFNDMFNDQKKIESIVGKHHSNIIVVSHSHLDCYMMFKTIKWAYGKSNCINIWKEKIDKPQEILLSLNDELAKHIKNKCLLNISGKFKKYAREVKDYLDMKLDINR